MATPEAVISEQLSNEASPLINEDTAAGLAEIFQALADPTRLRLISALMGGEKCVQDLSQAMETSQSAVSHQLRILRNLHLVRFRKAGRMVYYAIDDSHISDLFQRGLEHYLHRHT